MEQASFDDVVVARFARLFAGRTDAYGSLNRQGGSYQEKRPVTMATYRDHLDGRQSVGIYPLLNDGTATWLCWDFDRDSPNLPQAEVDRVALMDALAVAEQAAGAGLSAGLALELSKRKGAHLWLLPEQPASAASLRRLGRHLATLAGVTQYELFPKQDMVSIDQGEGVRYGNFVHLPYFDGFEAVPQRRVMLDFATRRPLLLIDWLDQIEPCATAVLEAAFADLPAEDYEPAMAAVISGRARNAEAFPCTPKLLNEGKDSGGRNDHAFALALRLQHSSHPPETRWLLFRQWNGHNRPPLDERELKRTFDSAAKYKGFWCEHAVMEPYCEDRCPIYRHKIRVARLRKIDTRPAIYYLAVKDQDVRLSVDDLYAFSRMARQSIEQANVAPPAMKQPDWYAHVQGLLEDVEVIAAPREASNAGMTQEMALNWIYDGPLGEDRTDLLRGRRLAFRDQLVFRADALLGWLNQRLHSGALDAHELYELLRPLGLESIVLKVAGRPVRVWAMPADRPGQPEPIAEDDDGYTAPAAVTRTSPGYTGGA